MDGKKSAIWSENEVQVIDLYAQFNKWHIINYINQSLQRKQAIL